MTEFKTLTTSNKITLLMGSRKDATQKHLSYLLEMTPETFRARMRNNDWKINELYVLADFFDISKEDLV